MWKKTFKSVSKSENILPCGKQPSMNKFTDMEMKSLRDHILSHNPAISQYRRNHAPNWLYLSPELTIQSMLGDYNSRREEYQLQ